MQRIIKINLISGFSHIYVGFSGGADSTALLVAMQQAASDSEFTIEAVHFEHGIRGEASRKDAQWCRKFCEFRNIPFRQIDLQMEHTDSNLEATARQLRLDAWSKIVKSEIEAVVLGQHADDRIENLFLRMMRGSNATGLTSLRSSQKINNITFLRPLINVRRSEIEEFLIDSGITDWRTDHTNSECLYRRNAIRNNLMPLLREEFPECDRAIIKSISTLEEDAQFLEESADSLYQKIIKQQTEKDTNRIYISAFLEMHPALRPRVLRLWLSDFFSIDTVPTYDFILRFNDAVANYADNRVIIPFNGTFSLLMEKGFISVEEEGVKKSENCTIEWNLKTQSRIQWKNLIFSVSETETVEEAVLQDRECTSVYFDLKSMPEKVIIRNRQEGDKMVPFGKSSKVKLKKILQNSELTLNEKREIPVITTLDDEIIWIPGVRRANFADISNSCSSTLNLKMKIADSILSRKSK